MSRLLPLEDRIVVRPDEAKKQTEGGIIIPDNAQQRPACGEIIAVGPGKLADPTLKKILGFLNWAAEQDGAIVPDQYKVTDTNAIPLKPGDKVLYGRFAGTEITHEGEELLVIRVSDVITIIE